MRVALAVAVKDLRSEARGREIAPAMVAFALALVFLLTFVLPPGAGRAPVPLPKAGAVGARDAAAAFLWTAILFAAVIGFARGASLEREGSRIEALALSPADPAAVFFGKVLSGFVYLIVMQAAMLPLFILLLDVPPGQLLPEVLPVALGVNAGISAAGTIFGTASQYSRARELMLTLLAFPVMLPVMLAAIRLTSSLMVTGALEGETRWIGLIATYDIILMAVGAVTFEYVIEE